MSNLHSCSERVDDDHESVERDDCQSQRGDVDGDTCREWKTKQMLSCLYKKYILLNIICVNTNVNRKYYL